MRVRRLVRTPAMALVALPITLGTFTAASPPASAAWAHGTGWHQVCADTLTMYLDEPGPNGDHRWILTRGDYYHIDYFRNAGERAHGHTTPDAWGPIHGYVHNGWFC